MVVGVIWLIPTLGLLITSLIVPSQISSVGWWKVFANPSLLSWENYRTVFNDHAITTALLTTFEIAIGGTLLPLFVGAMAAYAFAWLDFPGRDWIFIGVVASIVVPYQMALIPVFSIYNHLSLFDTVIGIVLFHTAFGLPFAIFLLRNYFLGIPKELMEAARIDGASELTYLPAGHHPAGPAGAGFAGHLPVPVDLERPAGGPHLRTHHAADNRGHLHAVAGVRQQHQHHRAGVVPVARGAAGGVLRLPALLRAGPAGGFGQVEAKTRRGAAARSAAAPRPRVRARSAQALSVSLPIQGRSTSGTTMLPSACW